MSLSGEFNLTDAIYRSNEDLCDQLSLLITEMQKMNRKSTLNTIIGTAIGAFVGALMGVVAANILW